MKTAILVVAALSVVACGGSGSSVDPSGVWLMTDAAKTAGCAAVAPETITVIASGHELQGYAMDASWCGETYCELQGSVNGTHRDVVFRSDGTAGGNRTDATGCLYTTNGQRAH